MSQFVPVAVLLGLQSVTLVNCVLSRLWPGVLFSLRLVAACFGEIAASCCCGCWQARHAGVTASYRIRRIAVFPGHVGALVAG